jgi:hypothetical protein
MNTTFFYLLAEFETLTPTLEQISKKYLGIEPATANYRASIGKLPLPTFRTVETQKAPRLVHIEDLAEMIDKGREAGKKQFEYFNKRG